MLPIILDVKALKTAIIGGGAQACARLTMLDEAGASGVKIYCPLKDPQIKEANACEEMRLLAGARLIERLPSVGEMRELALVFAANLTEADAVFIVDMARQNGVLVNVEDVKPHCDFHVPAIVRRGDLVLTVSTGGKSPALARRLRQFLAARFAPIWRERLTQIGAARDAWRAEGLGFKEVTARCDIFIDEKEWMQCPLEKNSKS